jgi:cyclic pyranopterin phosphate synthase
MHMVDVGHKAATRRVAVAEARVRLGAAARRALTDPDSPKGDVQAAVRLAGIMAAKRTADLIPLCHPLPLSHVSVTVTPRRFGAHIVARAETTGPTGVEMEALTAASVAALTLYDMLKAIERGIVIEAVQLVEKTGGKSGPWRR